MRVRWRKPVRLDLLIAQRLSMETHLLGLDVIIVG